MPETTTPDTPKRPLRVEVVGDKPKPKSKWEHPLVIALFSFLLTGIIGATVGAQIQRRNADIDRNARHYENSTTAIAGFSDALYLRYVRGGYLHSALKRHAAKTEVAERKRLYDEAAVAQESGLFGKELKIREALQEAQYSEFESLYDDRVRPAFHRLDDVLTVATDQYVANPKAVVNSDDIAAAYADSRNCAYALINFVFLEVSAKQYRGRSGLIIQSSEEARQEFDAQCPPSSQ